MNFTPQFAMFIWVASYTYTTTSILFSACSRKIKPLVDYLITISFCKVSVDALWNKDVYNKYYYTSICDFFYYKLPKEEIKPNSKMLISVFPHGIFCWGFGILGGFNCSYSSYKVITNILLKTPLIGYWLEKINCIGVDKPSMTKVMNNDNNIMILPGGFNEIMTTRKFEYNIYIPIGFIVLSCKHEYSIMPCLSLGENEVHSVLTFPKFLWPYIFKFLRKIPLPLALPYWFRRVPVWPIRGNVIKCQNTDDPNDIRDKIKIELERIFNENINEYCEFRNSLNTLPKVTPDMYSIYFITPDTYNKKCD